MPGENQNLPIRVYTKQYLKILQTVFGVRKAFAGALAPIQMVDGISENTTAFSVKACNTPVTIGTYDTGANVQFGSGTGSGSRFGNMTEIIYSDVDVNYDYTMTIHEGIDRFTVNNGFDKAIADRLKLQSEAEVRYMNSKNGAYIAAAAGQTETLANLQDATILALFDKISAYYTNLEVNVPITAYVKPDIFNAIVDNSYANTSKGSKVNVDKNTIDDFKGFKIVKEPAKYFATGIGIYFAPDSSVIPFVGIEMARTIEAQDFNGVKLQAAAKGGAYTPTDNKVAIVKVEYSSMTVSATTATVAEDATTTVTISGNVGAVTAASSASSVATASVNGTTVTITGVAAGSANITLVDTVGNVAVVAVTVTGE